MTRKYKKKPVKRHVYSQCPLLARYRAANAAGMKKRADKLMLMYMKCRGCRRINP